MSAPTAADFRKAADVIRTGGLTKGSFEDATGESHCTVGAVIVAVNGGLNYGIDENKDVAPHVQILGDMLGGPTTDHPEFMDASHQWTVTHWNDRLETTPEDVVALLEQAAEKLEAEL